MDGRIIVAQKKRVALNGVCLVYLVFPLLIHTIETMKIALIVLVIGVYLYEVQGHAAMNIPPSKWNDQIIIMARVVLYHPRRPRGGARPGRGRLAKRHYMLCIMLHGEDFRVAN